MRPYIFDFENCITVNKKQFYPNYLAEFFIERQMKVQAHERNA